MADNLLDYISSLHDEGLNDEQIFRLAQIWKKENPQPEVKEVEEVVETSEPQKKYFTTIDYSKLNLSNSFNPIDTSLSAIQNKVNFTERQLLNSQKEQEGEPVELEEIELVANNPYNPVEMGEHLGIDVWTNLNDKNDRSGLNKLNAWAQDNNTYTQDLGGPNENTYDLDKPIVLGGNEVAIDDYLNDQLKSPAHWAMAEGQNNQTTWLFTNDPTAQQKIKNKYFSGLGEDEKGYGPDIFKGIAPVNLPDLQGRRIFAGMQEVKDQWNWEYDKIFDWGEKYLDEDELEFKNLNTLASKIKEEDADIDSLIPQIEDIISKYEPPAEIDRGAKNEALEEFKLLVKQARETKDYSKVIEYIAKKENYGTKLYDTTTGEVIGIDKATTKDLENYEKSEELAITTEYEDLELGLESQYYKLLTLSKDVRELNNKFGKGRTGFTGMGDSMIVPGVIRDEDNNIVGYFILVKAVLIHLMKLKNFLKVTLIGIQVILISCIQLVT